MIGLLLSLAGAAGAVCRFLVDSAVRSRTPSPIGSTIVNTSACFLLGMLAGWIPETGSQVAAVAGVGFLGGYSTFSTASVEAARMLLDGRRWDAIRHTLLMLVLGLAAAGLGLALAGLLR